MHVVGKKFFGSSRVTGNRLYFQVTPSYSGLKTGKSAGTKKCKQLHLFSQCFGNSHSYIEIEMTTFLATFFLS